MDSMGIEKVGTQLHADVAHIQVDLVTFVHDHCRRREIRMIESLLMSPW